MGCVDGNRAAVGGSHREDVAARMGCVDGNIHPVLCLCALCVAARMGCVDGNERYLAGDSMLGMSQPAWAAWIEIALGIHFAMDGVVAARMGCVDGNTMSPVVLKVMPVAARMGCVDGNTGLLQGDTSLHLSQPAWAAWIEIPAAPACPGAELVAARMGCVDGNVANKLHDYFTSVAARMGCVDGNWWLEYWHYCRLCRSPHGLRGLKLQTISLMPIRLQSRSPHGLRGLKSGSAARRRQLASVAARMGCVDGNPPRYFEKLYEDESQPAWAAWIEIAAQAGPGKGEKSQPAWAAWIEMSITVLFLTVVFVAARMGCVDGNIQCISDAAGQYSRSPHGLRGLKSVHPILPVNRLRRSPHGLRGLKSDAEAEHPEK